MGANDDTVGADPFVADVKFTSVAIATGGKSSYSRNDVDRKIDESARDGMSFYTSVYSPSTDSNASKPFRKLRSICRS